MRTENQMHAETGENKVYERKEHVTGSIMKD